QELAQTRAATYASERTTSFASTPMFRFCTFPVGVGTRTTAPVLVTKLAELPLTATLAAGPDDANDLVPAGPVVPVSKKPRVPSNARYQTRPFAIARLSWFTTGSVAMSIGLTPRSAV